MTFALPRRRLLLILLALGLLGGVVGGVIRLGKPPAAQAQVESTTEEAKLTASGGAQDDFFGSGLAVSGDTAVVGAYGGNSAYVFVRSEGSWTPQAKLTVSDGGAFDLFGWSVAISGDTAIVGAPLHTIGENFREGSAYVFVRNGTTWSQEAKLTSSNGLFTGQFGNSVAISGDTVVVGAHRELVGLTTQQGRAYVFVRNGTTWSPQAQLTQSDGGPGHSINQFGSYVAVSGDTAVVGATGHDNSANNNGSVYVFVRSGTSWSEQQKLITTDDVSFFSSAAVSGDTVVVGDNRNQLGENFNQGAAYVFVRSGTSWSQEAKLTASDGLAGDELGSSVGVSGDKVVVGAWLADVGSNTDQGAAYVFARSEGVWSPQAKLVASDGADSDTFGRFLAFSGDTAVLGAIAADVGSNSNQGAAYAYFLGEVRLPVVFVPGISGSVLVDGNGNGDELWFGNPTDWHQLSLFDSDSPDLTIVATDALRTATLAGKTEEVYGPFLARMADAGFHEYSLVDDGTFRGERLSPPGSGCDTAQKDDDGPKPDLFIFPYDWRKDNGPNAALLRDYIDCVREFYPGSDVDIVAHSMGSLLSRRYILDNAGDHHVNALITIGGPFLGAPKLLYVLETGDFLGPPLSALPGVNSTFKHVTGSFRGAHQLLPSSKYFELANELAAPDPMTEKDRDLNGDGDFEVLSYTEVLGVVDQRYGREGFAPGSTNDAFHQGGQDDWRGDTSGVKYFHIVGKQAGHNTIGGVVATWETQCQFGFFCSVEPIVKLRLTQGDGTVPVLSAQRDGVLQNLNAPGATVIVASASSPSQNDSVDHNGMMLTAVVQDQVLQWLEEASSDSSPGPGPTAASASSSGASPVAAAETPTVHPYNYVTISGAESVVVQDSSGNSTAPVGGIFVGKVPGVTTYFLGENTRLLAIPTSGTEEYELSFQSTGLPIGIEVRVGTGDTTSRAVRYRDLVLPDGAAAQLSFMPAGVEELQVDTDGDATFETVVSPTVDVSGAATEDEDGPVITVTETPEGEGVPTTLVTLTAEDAGSGVASLFFSLDGTQFQEYSGPMVLDQSKTPILYAFADDNVANRSTLVHPLQAPPTPVGVPTLSQWMLIVLAGVLALTVAWRLRRDTATARS